MQSKEQVQRTSRPLRRVAAALASIMMLATPLAAQAGGGIVLGAVHEGDEVGLQFFGERVINVELPTAVSLTVTYAETVVKGDTTSSVLKDATTDTGLVVKVPAFIKTDDIIRVDTRDGSYLERQK